MIQSVHDLLQAWGHWVIHSETRKVGFPPVCPMFRDSPSGGGWGSSPPVGAFRTTEDYYAVNRAVGMLSAPDRVLCAEYYVVRGGWRAVCQRMAIGRSALYERLDDMHANVSRNLALDITRNKV